MGYILLTVFLLQGAAHSHSRSVNRPGLQVDSIIIIMQTVFCFETFVCAYFFLKICYSKFHQGLATKHCLNMSMTVLVNQRTVQKEHIVVFIMPRCACASEVYGSVFVCVSVCVWQLLKSENRSVHRKVNNYNYICTNSQCH